MKGQISLDFLLAVAIALFVLAGLVLLGADVAEMQAKEGIRQQLRVVGTGLATIVSYSAVLNDAGTEEAIVTYDIPKILVLGEEGKQPCTIAINGNNLELGYELFDLETGSSETISASVPFADPHGMNIDLGQGSTGACGGTVTITKS